MDYKFPHILKLDDVLPAIEGRTEFIIANRGDHTIVNYVVAMDDTFPPVKTAGGSARMRQEESLKKAIRRELRGIIFDEHGNIISRRLHKFFNVNERDETLSRNINFSRPHVILEKLDGSMITPFMSGGVIRWGTKMGITDVAKPVEEWVKDHPGYIDFAASCIDAGVTPIFEWCSNKQRIVVDHPKDRLVLIAVRDNITGEYESYDALCVNGKVFEMEVVRAFVGNVVSMQHLIDECKNIEGMEGWVVRFDDGHMVKVKGDWYVRMHKTKDGLSQEKTVIDMIINEKIDDAKAFMLDDDRKKVEEFVHKFWEGFEEYIGLLREKINIARSRVNYDRKRFALEEAPHFSGVGRALAFSIWDGDKELRSEALNIIRKHLGTQTKVDYIRFMWKFHKWNYGGLIDE